MNKNFSLLRQFAVFSFTGIVLIALVMGLFVSRSLTERLLHLEAALTREFVDSNVETDRAWRHFRSRGGTGDALRGTGPQQWPAGAFSHSLPHGSEGWRTGASSRYPSGTSRVASMTSLMSRCSDQGAVRREAGANQNDSMPSPRGT